MIHPSYAELMAAINEEGNVDDEPVVTSRYSVVLATSKRARQIIGGSEPMIPSAGNKPLSTAVEEFYEGKVKILPDTILDDEEEAEAMEAEELAEEAEAVEEVQEEQVEE